MIDCGTLAREADQVALAKASHVAWVLPATASGARRARPRARGGQPVPAGRELIIARHDERAPKAAMRELRRLAEQRQATLVLLPSLPDLAAGKLDRVVELAQVSLQAIDGGARRDERASRLSPAPRCARGSPDASSYPPVVVRVAGRRENDRDAGGR